MYLRFHGRGGDGGGGVNGVYYSCEVRTVFSHTYYSIYQH